MSDIEFRVGDVYLFTAKNKSGYITYFNMQSVNDFKIDDLKPDETDSQFLVEVIDGHVDNFYNEIDPSGSIEVKLVNGDINQTVFVGQLAPYTEDDE